MFDKKVYVERRKQLQHAVGSGLIVLLGNEESSMNYKDNIYPFRQDSSFLYFFGIDRPALIGIIDIDNDSEILFGDDFTTEEMIWTGYREPLNLLSDSIGISTVKPKKDLWSFIRLATEHQKKIHFLPPYRPEQHDLLSDVLCVSSGSLSGMFSISLIKAIVAQRSYKSAVEIEEINRAVNTTAAMQLAAVTMAKEGMTEAQIAGKMQEIAIGAGGNLSFPTILTQQGQILHNGYSHSLLTAGSLVLSDCGAETGMHYAGDLTRTFPVSDKFTSAQRDVYDIVLHAHASAVMLLQPGKSFRDIHLHACEKLTEGLQQLGIMKGDVKEAVALGAHALFFPCGLGHMMGLDTHDMENLGEQYVGYNEEIIKSTQFGLKSLRLAKPLEEGFVVTVEPGLYFNPALIDEWEANNQLGSFINYGKLKAYRNLTGIRVEEDFVITRNGSRLLGNPLAKTANEIEVLRLG
jgi:Xaa-Pro aminopeptidase